MRGIIYSLSGPAYAELLTVSLWSLRQHFQGPVAIFCGPGCREAMQPLYDDPRLHPLELIDHDLPNVRRHAHYCVKPGIALASPFDETVFLDADTLVCGEVDELFEAPLTVTQFADWVTTGKIISGRIRQWMEGEPELLPHDTPSQAGDLIVVSSVDGCKRTVSWEHRRVLSIEPKRGDQPRKAVVADAIAHELASRCLEVARPAINTGVFAFTREASKALVAWEELTLRGWRHSFTDELAMQLLCEYASARVVDDRWNWSVQFGKAAEPVIQHFHGRKHVRSAKGAAIWWPRFEECRREDVGGIQGWGGDWDIAVGERLASLPG